MTDLSLNLSAALIRGGVRFNNNRPSSVRPLLPTRIRVSQAPVRSSTQGRGSRSDEKPREKLRGASASAVPARNRDRLAARRLDRAIVYKTQTEFLFGPFGIVPLREREDDSEIAVLITGPTPEVSAAGWHHARDLRRLSLHLRGHHAHNFRGHSIRGSNQHTVEVVDIAAGDGPRRVAEQGSDRGLRITEVSCDRRKGVAHVRRHVFEACAFRDALQPLARAPNTLPERAFSAMMVAGAQSSGCGAQFDDEGQVLDLLVQGQWDKAGTAPIPPRASSPDRRNGRPRSHWRGRAGSRAIPSKARPSVGQTSTKASTRSATWASLWAGVGVTRSRSVPRATVG